MRVWHVPLMTIKRKINKTKNFIFINNIKQSIYLNYLNNIYLVYYFLLDRGGQAILYIAR